MDNVKLTDYRNIIKLYLSVILGNTLLFSIVFALFPETRDTIMRYDNILDSLTVIIFLATIIVSLPYLLMMRDRRNQFIYAGIPLIALLLLWAEVGIGPGPFDWVRPLYRFLKPLGTVTLLAVSGIFALGTIMIIISFVKYLTHIAEFREWVINHTPLILLLGSFFLFSFVSVFFDLNIVMRSTRLAGFIEELSEVNAAISLLFCALYLRNVVNYVRVKVSHKSV